MDVCGASHRADDEPSTTELAFLTICPSRRDCSTPFLEWYMFSSSLFSGCIYRRYGNRRRLLHGFLQRWFGTSRPFSGTRPCFPSFWPRRSRHVSIPPFRRSDGHRPGHLRNCNSARVETWANCKFALQQMAIREEGLPGP